MSPRHRWPSVQDCRLERAINRTLRTIPTLRIHGECVMCSRPAHDAHMDDCPILQLIDRLEKISGTIAPKEKRRIAC